MPLIVDIKVAPRSGRQKCVLNKAGKLKVFLKSPPEGGKANKELIKFLAKTLRLRQDQVEIIAGATSRSKRLKFDLEGTFEDLIAKLGIERQIGLFG